MAAVALRDRSSGCAESPVYDYEKMLSAAHGWAEFIVLQGDYCGLGTENFGSSL